MGQGKVFTRVCHSVDRGCGVDGCGVEGSGVEEGMVQWGAAALGYLPEGVSAWGVCTPPR